MIGKHNELLTHFVWNLVENHQVEWDKGEVRILNEIHQEEMDQTKYD